MAGDFVFMSDHLYTFPGPNSRAFARYRTIDDDMKREIINLIK